MKLKIALGTMLCVLTVALCSCSGGDVETAYLEGYPETPFAEAVEKYTRYVKEEDKVDFETKWSSGWKGDIVPDEELEKGEKPVTFVLIGEEESGKRILSFFMGYDANENQLRVVDVTGQMSLSDDEEISSFLNGIYNIDEQE